MLTGNKEQFKLRQTDITRLLNTKPIARLLVFAMAFFCAITLNVKAEPMEYNVCKTGCEYNNLNEIISHGNAGSYTKLYDGMVRLYDGIIINILDNEQYEITTRYANKLSSGIIYNQFEINGINAKPTIVVDNPETGGINLIVANLKITSVNITGERGEGNTLDNINTLQKANLNFLMGLEGNETINETPGNITIENADLYQLSIGQGSINGNIKNARIEEFLLAPIISDISIYDSEFKTISHFTSSTSILNIYNSTFEEFKYSEYDSNNDIQKYIDHITYVNRLNGIAAFSYDGKYNTFVHFNKEAKLKPGDKLNLVDYLDYYTEDKEIEYTIEDESIAKIENKELIAIKEGSTKVTVTTDDGHVVYRINLVVEKETISEKIDKMTIKVPITGSKVKAWVVVISVILLGVIGVCSYMLIKRKK